MFKRRSLLRAGLAGTAALACPLPRYAWAETVDDRRLVLVILRGGLDGLAAVPAYGEPQFKQLRGNLALPQSELLDLDGYFGLHPSLARLHDLYRQRELTVFHGVASAYRERSHFDGQKLLENGTNHPLGASDGWLNRAVGEITRDRPDKSEYAMAFSQSIPLVLHGAHPVNSWSPSPLPDAGEDLIRRIADMYTEDLFLSAQLNSAVATREFAEAATDGDGMEPMRLRGGNAQLPALIKTAARFLANEDGPRIAVFESDGWDTHANQNGQLANLLAILDEAVAILKDESGAYWDKTVVLMVTEFGRTVAVNGTGGTDHGTAGVAFMAGGAVNGGKVVTDWRGLAGSDLYEGRDLYPSMDMRSIFKSVLHDYLRVPAAALESVIFPQSSGAASIPDLVRG
jgi:uncharacterized protein (DUF1501 family)